MGTAEQTRVEGTCEAYWFEKVSRSKELRGRAVVSKREKVKV